MVVMTYNAYVAVHAVNCTEWSNYLARLAESLLAS